MSMTIYEIDSEIKRLEALKKRKQDEKLPEKSYVGKLFRNGNGSIGKIIKVELRDGVPFFTGKSVWFDNDDMELISDENTFRFEDFEVITNNEFLEIYIGWTSWIARSFGVDMLEYLQSN